MSKTSFPRRETLKVEMTMRLSANTHLTLHRGASDGMVVGSATGQP
jgi:hypothetical protein